MDYKKLMKIAFSLDIKPHEFWQYSLLELAAICEDKKETVTKKELQNLITSLEGQKYDY